MLSISALEPDEIFKPAFGIVKRDNFKILTCRVWKLAGRSSLVQE